MEATQYLTADQMRVLSENVNRVNRSLEEGSAVNAELDKDGFLKILITQLTHQDPTQPLEDKEFIAQMAQFSTLEQITNMSNELSQVSGMIARSQAITLLGKTVEILQGDNMISGVVEEVIGGAAPQVLIEDRYYDFFSIERVKR